MESVENILKKPLNVHVCFTDPEICRVLSRMAVSLAGSRSEKSTATLLHLIEKENHDNQNKLEDFIDIIDKSRLTLRYFATRYDNYVSEIINVSKEQNSDFIVADIHRTTLSPDIFQNCNRLKSDPAIS